MEQPAKVMNVNELANYLRVHRSTVYRLLRERQLPGFKIGSDWRFNLETIDRWCQDAEQLARGVNRIVSESNAKRGRPLLLARLSVAH